MIMNSTERILNRINAIELESHDVSLGLNEDTRASIKAAKEARIKIESTKQSVRTAIEGLKKDYKELYDKALAANINIENFTKAAKELGLDVPNDFKSEYGLMKDHQKLGQAKQGELTKITL